MFAITALINLFNIILSPVIIHTTPSAVIIHNNKVIVVEENNEEEIEFESELDTDSEDETLSHSSTIFSVDDVSSLCSEESFYEEDATNTKIEAAVEVKSAVPTYVFSEWDGKDSEREPTTIPCAVELVDLEYEYDARYLTASAREEAQARSMKVLAKALKAARVWETKVPLQADQHTAPYSNIRPSRLGGMGLASPLRQSWTEAEFDVNVTVEVAFTPSWSDEEEDYLPNLNDLQAFFTKRG